MQTCVSINLTLWVPCRVQHESSHSSARCQCAWMRDGTRSSSIWQTSHAEHMVHLPCSMPDTCNVRVWLLSLSEGQTRLPCPPSVKHGLCCVHLSATLASACICTDPGNCLAEQCANACRDKLHRDTADADTCKLPDQEGLLLRQALHRGGAAHRVQVRVKLFSSVNSCAQPRRSAFQAFSPFPFQQRTESEDHTVSMTVLQAHAP